MCCQVFYLVYSRFLLDLHFKPLELKFWIPGSVVPKARPRVTRNGTYYPLRYQQWRIKAELKILSSLDLETRKVLPITRAEIRIILQGKHRGDLDNLAGAILDIMTPTHANIILDDRISCLPRLSIEHNSEGKTGVWVEIKTLCL